MLAQWYAPINVTGTAWPDESAFHAFHEELVTMKSATDG